MPEESSEPIPRLAALFERAESSDYIGEDVTQLEHALQAAHLASEANAPRDEILAALLHDVGHLCDPQAAQMQREEVGALGTEKHEDIGADFLNHLGFAATVTELVRGHVAAKRYLVSATPGYFERLSDASRHTLELQGGAMDAAERAAFLAREDSEAQLRVRSWDEAAKVPALAVPAFEHYVPLLEAHLSTSRRRSTGRGRST